MAGKIREWLSSKGVVGSRGRGRSYELGEAAPGIAGVANLVLKAMLMRGARMNCATHHGTIHAMNVRRPGFQGSLCLVGSITSHGWSCILWRRRHESQARKEGAGLGTGRKNRETLGRRRAEQPGVWSLCRGGQDKARRRIEKRMKS